MKYLFLCGMIRSGTTMLAKVFRTHRRCAAVWDTFTAYFLVLARNPGSLDRPVLAVEREALAKQFMECAGVYAPALIPRLRTLSASTWQSLFVEFMAAVQECYGKGAETEIVGIKECWVDGTAELLAEAFPNLYVIHIVRDPRAVVASQAGRNRYPLLFMVEYWRQSANLALLYRSLAKDWSRRYLLVRYEDLVRDPEAEAGRLCRFLDIPYDPAMIDADRFRDGRGRREPSNSSYGELRQISTESVGRWKGVLTAEEIGMIERLCRSEMAALGYEASGMGARASLWSLYRYRDPVEILAAQHRNSPYLTGRHRGLILLRELLRRTGRAGAALMPEALGRRVFWNNLELAGVASKGGR